MVGTWTPRHLSGRSGAVRSALTQLRALFDDSAGLIELRWRQRDGRWDQRFAPASATAEMASIAIAQAATTDVFVGVLARRRRRGRRADVLTPGRVVWVDLDNRDALERAHSARPSPTLIVASGSPGHVHAYWRLDAAVEIDELERLNRALAGRLDGDPQSCDPARVLRLAGTLSHKRQPPAAVTLRHVSAGAVSTDGLRDALEPLPTASPWSGRPAAQRVGWLFEVAPALYVEALTGKRVGRSRKIVCPLHDDHTPSLHVYPDAQRGWYCFGCGRGGTVIDLAAALWQRPTSGPAFVELRADLEALLRSSG